MNSVREPVNSVPVLNLGGGMGAGGIARRGFLKTLGVGLGVPLVARVPLRAASPNGMLQHACIGVGGMGWNDLQNFRQHPKVRVQAICDVDVQHLEKAAEVFPEARRYRDWRELLRVEGDRLDSVNVTVPDHMHYPIALTAIRAGKHVYCQKPMCHDVAEVRALTLAAAEKGVVTQLGTQAASGTGDRLAVHYLKEGVLGKVRHLYLCSNRPGAVEEYRLKGPRPERGQAPPASLDWDLWIGNAPMRPFAPDIYHPTKWRAWLDFGTGWSGDIGCHIFDSVWKGLGLEAPRTVVAEVQESWKNSPERRSDVWPQANHITWRFPGNARTESGDLVVEWFDGEYYPPEEVRAMYSVPDYPPESSMVVGSEGAMLLAYASGPVFLPEKKFEGLAKPDLEPRNHYHQFVDACLGLVRNESHFGQTGPMTEAILLGTVAVRVPGVTLEWDRGLMKLGGAGAADRYLRRNYREGWGV